MKYLKYLLVFLPVSIAFEIFHMSGTFIFIAACLSIIPLAGIMGEATENLAGHAGPKAGGFLNATFGNATELIIAVFAISSGQADVAKASLAGSIIGNVLLVLGASMLFGGFGRIEQRFNQKASEDSTTLLLFSVMGLTIPAIFLHFVSKENFLVQTESISLFTAVVMMVVYVLGSYYSFKTGKDVLGSEHTKEAEKIWSVKKSITILAVATLAVAYESELLVKSIETVAKSLGWNEMFIGIIVLAIIGNAAEHSTAVMMAIKDKMDVALEIAIGSSLQIALFVAPALVFISLLIGKPMSIIFNPLELVGIASAVIAAIKVSQDGKSSWLEGMVLMAIYMIIGCLFFIVP